MTLEKMIELDPDVSAAKQMLQDLQKTRQLAAERGEEVSCHVFMFVGA